MPSEVPDLETVASPPSNATQADGGKAAVSPRDVGATSSNACRTPSPDMHVTSQGILSEPGTSEPALPLSQPRQRKGITGIDLSIPIYDGTSQNAADHLIDLDSESMERYPDVRAYFWKVGREVKLQGKEESPIEADERITYDQELVRAGREYIRWARRQGRGYYFNKDRHFVQKNQPGDLWYCMPAAAAVTTMHEDPDVLSPQPDEGCFFNQWIGEQEVHPMSLTILTNLRAPVLWASHLTNRIKPGSCVWDNYIARLYSRHHHPVVQAFAGREPHEIAFDLRPDPLSLYLDGNAFDPEDYWPKPPEPPLFSDSD